MIKCIGLFLALIFFTLMGTYFSQKLRKRRDYLSTILLFLNRLLTDIRYKSEDLSQMIFHCADDELTPLKNVDDNNYIPVIDTLPFQKEDKSMLKDFFSRLGTTDVEGQISHIKLYTDFFNEQYDNAKEEIKRKSKLYQMLGFFIGLAFVVMFI